MEMDNKMTLSIREGEQELFSMGCEEIIGSLAANDPLMRKDFESAFAYFADKFGASEGIIAVDVSFILTADRLDGRCSNAVFWLTLILMRFGVMKKISPGLGMKLIPALLPVIGDVTKAHELKARRGQSVMDFVKTSGSELERIKNGECTTDEAMERILKTLPSESAGAMEYRAHEEFLDVIDRLIKVAETCAYSGYSERLKEYREKIINNVN